MKFTSIPDNFSPLDEGLVYKIDLEALYDAVDVSIVNAFDNRLITTLRFARTRAVTVDIARYVRPLFSPQPSDGATEAHSDSGRMAAIVVKVGSVQSETRYFSLFAMDGLSRLLTTAPAERTIAYGEFDEIAYYAPAGGRIVVTAEMETGEMSSRIITLRTGGLPSVLRLSSADYHKARSITVSFEADGRSESVSYDVVSRPQSALRMAWVASSGAIEYYTFPTCKICRREARKERIYGRNGYEPVSISGERVVVAVSDFEPQAQIAALEEIITSPHVWYAGDGGFHEVDVVSQSASHSCDGSLNTVTVEFRCRKREEAAIC